MKSMISGGICPAAVVALGMAVFAQMTVQAQAPPQAATAQQSSSAEQQVTITGCVQREADYRRARDAGRGGVAGTGVGVGNEFVLMNAAMSAGAAPAAPTGTAGTASGNAYELTGQNESQVEKYVGRRVEIVGKLKAAETGGAGPTGGPTAGAPPRGVDVTSKDLKLRELEVTSVREATGTCPATGQ